MENKTEGTRLHPDYYKASSGKQVWDFIQEMGLDFFQGNVLKEYKCKNGKTVWVASNGLVFTIVKSFGWKESKVIQIFGSKHASGYISVGNEYLHRIIAKLFIENPSERPCVKSLLRDEQNGK